MPRKTQSNEENENELVQMPEDQQSEVDNLSRMLAAVLEYLSDEENEEIDIEYLFNNTEGLREWHNQYREKNRKVIEKEIRESLGELSLDELQKIREQIKGRQH